VPELTGGPYTEFPRRPKLKRGSLDVFDPDTKTSQVAQIPFQYNPEKLQRTLAARAAPKEGSGNVGKAREEVRRVLGPPTETISMSIILDAADQLSATVPDSLVLEEGLYPALATLELLLYPKSLQAIDTRDKAQMGKVQLQPADLPLVILSLTEKRKMPVMLTSFSISEEAFDHNLNPIRVKVDLGMRVLTYMELEPDTLGYETYLTYQQKKESASLKFTSSMQPAAQSHTTNS